MKITRIIPLLWAAAVLAACSAQATPLPTAQLGTLIPAGQAGLSGKLVVIQAGQSGNRLIELDLGTGQSSLLLQAPANSWLSEAVVSPDHTQVVMTYAPPPTDSGTQSGNSDLMLMPLNASSSPQVFISRSEADETYFYPAWAADGASIYYTHRYSTTRSDGSRTYQNDIENGSQTGRVSTVIAHALRPAISVDGTLMAYLSEDNLYLASTDGSNPTALLPAGEDSPVGMHMFNIDGSQVIFSMVNPPASPTTSSWPDGWLGIRSVNAQDEASDWYSVSIDGGTPQRLTDLNETGLSGVLSPDGSHIAFIAGSGLYVMNWDGSSPVRLSSETFIGTVQWIP